MNWITTAGLAIAAFFGLRKRDQDQDQDREIPTVPLPAMHPHIIRRVIRWRDTVEDAVSNRPPVRVVDVLAIIAQESAGLPEARGSFGEVGLMQVRPTTALADYNNATGSDLDGEQLALAAVNIEVGTWYYWQRLLESGGDRLEALRAYNAGSWGARQNPDAGREYANQVLFRAAQLEALL